MPGQHLGHCPAARVPHDDDVPDVERDQGILDGRRLRFVAHGSFAGRVRRSDDVPDRPHLEDVAGIGAQKEARHDAAVRAGQQERDRILALREALEGRTESGPPAPDEDADSAQELLHQRGPSITQARQ